ncbi:hypothetical protein HRG_001684 [Hirsutella rhossiliensis]|uniref:Uncharacterized protein n=1 Tax=Hirsutella rhossiliensis TaxID=111463 RepID=A0A9P8SLY7_9HYPO|nr:uncharacterized protein HRG_01684 [Hirsutella rhossiliensis]KAH0966275.1 hypothetical protein HRG_01684 [Hirsutella rhossiliensis]
MHPRDASNVCGTDMKLCPSSLGGNCCPGNYECARESCYATTKGPSTCGTKVGWYACAAVYGGGCCPDGYMCQRAGNCVPPSGSPYTFGCPASQYLCPSSMNYGCCPNGMGCAVDQCYSTNAAPVTRTMVITTTEQGLVTELTTTATALASPASPTAFPEVDPDMDSEDQKVLKYYPAAIPKVSPPGGSNSGISPAQLGGIVAGCVSFAILVLLAAFLLWKRFRRNSSTAKEGRRQPEMSSGSHTMNLQKADWDADAMSVDAIVTTPCTSRTRPSPGRVEPPSVHGSTELALTEQTPTTPAERGYYDHASGRSPATYSEHRGMPAPSISHASHESSPVYGGRHARALSDLSDVSSSVDMGSARERAPPAELEAQPWIAELPSSPSAMASAAAGDWSRLDAGVQGWVGRPPPPAYSQHQMTRIDGWANTVAASRLDVVDEEKPARYD